MNCGEYRYLTLPTRKFRTGKRAASALRNALAALVVEAGYLVGAIEKQHDEVATPIDKNTGELRPHLIGIDRLTNEIVDIPTNNVHIPDTIGHPSPRAKERRKARKHEAIQEIICTFPTRTWFIKGRLYSRCFYLLWIKWRHSEGYRVPFFLLSTEKGLS